MKFVVALLSAYLFNRSDAAVTNLVTSSSPVAGSANPHSAVFDYSKAVDNDYTSYFWTTFNSVGDTLQFDLGAS